MNQLEQQTMISLEERIKVLEEQKLDLIRNKAALEVRYEFATKKIEKLEADQIHANELKRLEAWRVTILDRMRDIVQKHFDADETLNSTVFYFASNVMSRPMSMRSLLPSIDGERWMICTDEITLADGRKYSVELQDPAFRVTVKQ